MKRIILLATLLILMSTLHAQWFYVKPWAGYSIGIQDNILYSNSKYYYETPDTNYTLYTSNAFSEDFGTGSNFGISLGKKISKNIGFEVGFGYSKCKKPELVSTEYYNYDYDVVTGYARIDHHYTYETTIRKILPVINFTTDGEKFIPHAGIGAILAFIDMKEFYKTYPEIRMPYFSERVEFSGTTEYKTTFSMGYTCALGADLRIGKGVYLFAEGNFSGYVFKPTTSEVTEYKFAGDDAMNELTEADIHIEFVDEISATDNTNPDKPSKALARHYNFNTFSILGGLKIDIGKKKQRED